MLAYLRGEIVGPSVPLREATVAVFSGERFPVPAGEPDAPAVPYVWCPSEESGQQEVLYLYRETPHRKYGTGLLHPQEERAVNADEGEDRQGADVESGDTQEAAVSAGNEEQEQAGFEDEDALPESEDNPLEPEISVVSADVRHPSTMGLSFCATFGPDARLVVRLPQSMRFPWQQADDAPVQVNGRYERCIAVINRGERGSIEQPAWRRLPAVAPDTNVAFTAAEVLAGGLVKRAVPLPGGAPLSLELQVFARPVAGEERTSLITVVLRNTSAKDNKEKASVLFQTLFSCEVEDGGFRRYPEAGRRFGELDEDEQSLALLYDNSAVWAIGHGCAAAWEEPAPGGTPRSIIADCMPTVETPSMTPDAFTRDGREIVLRMADLASLSPGGTAWLQLTELINEYDAWIGAQSIRAAGLHERYKPVAARHLDACRSVSARMRAGLKVLELNPTARTAFRLANRAMLLQQVATKQLRKRSLLWDTASKTHALSGAHLDPAVLEKSGDIRSDLGSWRAFQIAFLLMQLPGLVGGHPEDRETVDLIWFPTGGGKTEAYLGVMATYLFYLRLSPEEWTGLEPDGTSVIMRYTLRMLTTQQFQRAASLICAMDFIRQTSGEAFRGKTPFSLGLWLGGEGSPNTVDACKSALRMYKSGRVDGNPLVLTECPWCRAEIGRVAVKARGRADGWELAGIRTEGRLFCPDRHCLYGSSPESTLPVEVVDPHIYARRPSLIIATADKFATLAFKPEAGAIFGRGSQGSETKQIKRPPGLIIQDELHLIAGPLGTLYGLYEAVIEQLCTSILPTGKALPPKIIASTATIRGAGDQVLAIYGRKRPDGGVNLTLFPPPAIGMDDSFFGRYKRRPDGSLESGRMYVGINAVEYGSPLTTQVRTFSATLARAAVFDTPVRRDPWWTLLVFYNSLRELGSAKTLFDSDIRSRLRFIQQRDGIPQADRRTLKRVPELTSRLSQADIVAELEHLSTSLEPATTTTPDACLASNIIEVGVDIDRLSLMGVVGQPKTTAQYIQITGRVGRRWWERPGLILTIYSPGKSRDRSHFEQFTSYHRRLYERVEPTSATPFAEPALRRGLAGALLLYARQKSWAGRSPDAASVTSAVEDAVALIVDRCLQVQRAEYRAESLLEIRRIHEQLKKLLARQPDLWSGFPPDPEEDYLMLWPGQHYSSKQKSRGVFVQSSMRQVDSSSELGILQAYED
jgi:hypothetical protein